VRQAVHTKAREGRVRRLILHYRGIVEGRSLISPAPSMAVVGPPHPSRDHLSGDETAPGGQRWMINLAPPTPRIPRRGRARPLGSLGHPFRRHSRPVSNDYSRGWTYPWLDGARPLFARDGPTRDVLQLPNVSTRDPIPRWELRPRHPDRATPPIRMQRSAPRRGSQGRWSMARRGWRPR